MEIPFYLSFKEFEKNYPVDLAKWFDYYCDSDEVDFLKELVNQYYYYLRYNLSEDKLDSDATIIIRNCIFPYHEKSEVSFLAAYIDGKQRKVFKDENNNILEWKKITMMEYAQHILDKVHKYLNSNCILLKKHETVHDYINNRKIIESNDWFGYRIDYDLHQKTLPFLISYLPLQGKVVSESIFRNFNFTIIKIANSIDQKLKTFKASEFSIHKKLKYETKLQLGKNNISELQSKNYFPKIKINGSLQSIGYLFSQLIEKGFIEAPKRNGKDNTSAISRMILDHFEFVDKEEQPKFEDIRKTLFLENKLSADKQNQFRIPHSKIINTG